MLNYIRQNLITKLLNHYRHHSSQLTLIEQALAKKSICPLYFDHFALIDLPGPHTGISFLAKLFLLLDFHIQGQGYLPEKQNDFVWLAEADKKNKLAEEVLPQVVVADFRLEELPKDIRSIIEKYAARAIAPPFHTIQSHLNQLEKNPDQSLANQVIELIKNYLSGRDWPLPTLKEFSQVWEFNQLLAWVLVFGRKPNHFTLSVHLLSEFSNLQHFHEFIQQNLSMNLNTQGGIIKGGPKTGLEQSSTQGLLEKIQLADAEITLPTAFVEFIWRFPRETCQTPTLWEDFFTGFITEHATHVIQSLTAPK